MLSFCENWKLVSGDPEDFLNYAATGLGCWEVPMMHFVFFTTAVFNH